MLFCLSRREFKMSVWLGCSTPVVSRGIVGTRNALQRFLSTDSTERTTHQLGRVQALRSPRNQDVLVSLSKCVSNLHEHYLACPHVSFELENPSSDYRECALLALASSFDDEKLKRGECAGTKAFSRISSGSRASIISSSVLGDAMVLELRA